MRYDWTFDRTTQTLKAPSGFTITTEQIANMLADIRDCRHDLRGPWTGWRIRGNKLIPPFSKRAGPKLTPDTTKLFLRWIEAANQNPEHPQLRLFE